MPLSEPKSRITSTSKAENDIARYVTILDELQQIELYHRALHRRGIMELWELQNSEQTIADTRAVIRALLDEAREKRGRRNTESDRQSIAAQNVKQ